MTKSINRQKNKFQEVITIFDDKIYLFPRESGRWFYYFRYGNKTFKKSCGTTNLQKGREISIRDYMYVRDKEGLVPKRIKFQTLCGKFIEFKTGRVKPNTLTDYQSNVRFLTQFFNHKDIQTISEKDLELYKEWRENYYKHHKNKVRQVYGKDGKRRPGRWYRDGKKNHIVNREIGTLRSILTWSKRMGYLSESYRVPMWSKLEEKRREELLTKEQYLELKGFLESKWEDREKGVEKTKSRKQIDRFLLDVIQFVLNTGIRYPSELNNLMWGDVFLDQEFVVINGKSRMGKLKLRGVPVVGTPTRILEKLKKRWFKIHGVKRTNGGRPNPEDYVFVKENGNRVQHLRSTFKRTLRKCGIPENITMYSLRHSFVTKTLIERPDVSTKVLSEIVGHRDSSMIDKHYGHLQTRHLVEIMRKSYNNSRGDLE